MYKVALYIRLSKEDKNKNESESVVNQRLLLRTFAKDHNLEIINEYIDDGISGTTFDRPSFNKLIKDIENKKINMVITKDLSRLGRDYILTGHYIEKYFPENNVRYISLLDEIDTGIDSISNDITPFKSILNDMYAKDISNKIKSVKHAHQDLGLFIGSKAPYGYILDKKFPNKLFIDKSVAPVIKDIFYLASCGYSCTYIAKNLNSNKVSTPSMHAKIMGFKISKINDKWSSSRIREIIQNEVYIGNMVQRRMKKLNYKSKKNIRLPKSQWKIVQNTHEAIIDKPLFIKANKMIDKRKKTRIKSYDYSLKGFIYCHECNKKMGCIKSKNNIFYIRCNTYASSRNCTSHLIRMDCLESAVKNKLHQIFDMYNLNNVLTEMTKQKIAKRNNSYIEINKIKEYKDEILKINMQIDKLYNDKINNIILCDDFLRIYNKKIKEKKELADKVKNLSDNINKIDGNLDILSNNLINKFYNNLEITREIIYDLIEKIEIDKDKNILIFFKFNSKALDDAQVFLKTTKRP